MGGKVQFNRLFLMDMYAFRFLILFTVLIFFLESSSSSDSKPQKRQRSRTFRRADTNVVSVTFDALKTPGTMHAGEAANCARCEAILSHISKLETDGSEKVC